MASEFQKFHHAMRQLLKVPHSKLKEELEKEKAQKRQKRKAKPSASDARAFREQG